MSLGMGNHRFSKSLSLEEQVAAIGWSFWGDASKDYPLEAIIPDDSAEDTDTVIRWNDRSGNDDHLNQSVLANSPVYVADQANGKGSVSFDGANDTLEYKDGLDNIATDSFSVDLLFYLEGRGVSGDNGFWGCHGASDYVRLYWSGAISDRPVFYYQANGQGARYCWPNVTFLPGNYYYISCVAKANSSTGMKMFINGSEVTYVGGSLRDLSSYDMSQYNAPNDFVFGNVNGLNLYSEIKILQCRIKNDALTSDQISLINDYQNEKYNLSLS